MTKTVERQTPVRQSIHVECPIEEAFRLFTEGFAEWWPLASYSLTGVGAAGCEMEPWAGGRVLERTWRSEEREWGRVIAWEPPGRLEFTWHPGGRADRDQRVAVEFVVEADGTRVTVIHSGWEMATGRRFTALSGFAEFVSGRVLVGV